MPNQFCAIHEHIRVLSMLKTRNLHIRQGYSQNPAYRLIRHKVFCFQCFHAVVIADRVITEQRVFSKPSPLFMN
jgi:hypothetical protein